MKMASDVPLGLVLLYYRKDVHLLFSALCDIPLLGGKNADSYFKWESQLKIAKSIFFPPETESILSPIICIWQ